MLFRPPQSPSPSAARMARAFLRAVPALLHPSSFSTTTVSSCSPSVRGGNGNGGFSSFSSSSVVFGRSFHALCGTKQRWGALRSSGRVWAAQRDYRRAARRRSAAKRNNKELELNVSICIEEDLPDDPEILSIAELLRLNAPMAMKLAFDGLKESQYKTRDTAITDVGGFESVELSVLLCNDEFIRKLNKEWRDEDHATDVLSMSDHIPDLNLPILMLGDIVISMETAARQAEERGISLIDEIRILMVHGLLHLLGFDHEISEEAEMEMEKEEELILKSLGWAGKGLIQSAYDAAETNGNAIADSLDDTKKKEGSLRFYKPKFSYIFCDMDAVSPGVFLQGLLVYGTQGREIYRRNLDPVICREACVYSWENKVPLIAFSGGRCLTLFDHPKVESLHSVYHEPKAEIMSSVDQILAAADIQKVIFMDTAEGVSTTLRPYWAEATGDRASVVQAQADMLEIVPPGTSKGSGVKLLLDHLGVSPKEIMAIGDGENDVEMLELASLGVALSNGSEKTKAVANVIGASNDENGAADAIYRYAF
ncbi:hypothetical protein F8388_026290 [Cannabis sativa]|uniref:Haloacid dehalogenase-like hydrolase family protein n=1 Tax=Cannabis sativa TaxID=3483 RepID=A0A7J6E4E2_CANSA|nr:hypothetical protein F8388_026290 [Cannabis sativa]